MSSLRSVANPSGALLGGEWGGPVSIMRWGKRRRTPHRTRVLLALLEEKKIRRRRADLGKKEKTVRVIHELGLLRRLIFSLSLHQGEGGGVEARNEGRLHVL